MRVLKINSLCGVKNQLYSSKQYVDSTRQQDIHNGFFDINSIFWSEILSPEHVKKLIELAKIRLKDDNSVKLKAVMNKPDVFFTNFLLALNSLDTPTTEQHLFQYLETLEIVCYLHTRIYSSPFQLSISNGYICQMHSSLELAENCLLSMYNPYLPFIESKIIPKLESYNPEIVLLSGKPNIASFAIAKIIREKFNNVLIIATDHESDYYSMYKIKDLLMENSALFSIYHCVTMNESSKIIEKICNSASENRFDLLSTIPDIIYSTDGGKTIHSTLSNHDIKTNQSDNFTLSNKLMNIKAFPENHCYWNKCVFCGINSKYNHNGIIHKTWNLINCIERIKKIYELGVRKLWLLDEAIPVNILYDFTHLLISNGIDIKWHLRTRIESQFLDNDFIALLWQSGLRHIIFGLESASARILKMINKTNDCSNYIELCENVVHKLTTIGIQVHFSAIIGFPTETDTEIDETFDFLLYLKNTYSGFSYNVNTFYLDIGSEMYKRWERFGISTLSYPCAPKYYLDNHLDWNSMISPSKFSTIQRKQTEIMMQQYPWYPKGALITPNTFFSFWEHSRYALFQSEVLSTDNNTTTSIGKMILLSPKVSVVQLDSDKWLLYHLDNHNYVIGGEVLYDIANATHNDTFESIIKKHDQLYSRKIETLILQLARMNFFIQ